MTIASLLFARAESVTPGSFGGVYTISRALGAASTLSLGVGTNGNLSLVGTTINAAAAIAAGVTQKAVVFEELGDQAQRYAVLITGRSAAATPTPPATTPTVTLSAAQSAAEGASGATVYTYTVTRSTIAGAVAVPWSFTAGTTSADDFTGGVYPTGGAVNLADGAASGTFQVSVNGDAVVEGNETFTVMISTPAGYAADATTSATGTILNDDIAGAPATYRQAANAGSTPDGVSAMAATKRRTRTISPIFVAGNTGPCRITMNGHYINSSWQEVEVSWAGVTAYGVQVQLLSSTGTSLGVFRAKVGGQESVVPAPGDVVLDPFLPADFGQTTWPMGGSFALMTEIDGAIGTLIPVSYIAGSVGDSGESSFSGGTTSFGQIGSLSANGGSSTNALCRPLKIEFQHTAPAVMYIADSRANGKGNEPSGRGLVRGGYAFQSAKNAQRPLTKYAIDGDRLSYWVAGSTWRLAQAASYTDFYIDLGYNDINSVAAATAFSSLTALCDMIRAANPTARIHIVAIGLRTSSATNNWLAPPDQTPNVEYADGAGTRRSVYNDSLAALVGTRGIVEVIDLKADYYHDAANPAVYFSDGTNKKTTIDGAHLSAFGEARVGGVGTVLTNSLTNLPNS
ncbi:Calx-beta domain-containing protein [Sphingomonas sp.]|jgi:hypothetical protein|uniref:Calx-beta domain-containing protein n=1 Tax=Sphingomonas sp. TaxID=28214 RepID=UPI002EDACF16